MDAERRSEDVAAVDAFIGARKALVGPVPEWVSSTRPGEMEAKWIVADDAGILRAELRFRVLIQARQHPSISLLFRDRPVWRLDLVSLSECKPNPHWGARVGVPPRVCGPHCHEWGDNRLFLLSLPPKWVLPCRRPLPAAVRRLPQAIPWLADRLLIEIDVDQRGLDVPPRMDLFGS